MTDQNNQIQNVPQASQNINDAAKRESHQWLNPETWRTMQMIAQTFVQSGAMPKSMDTAPKVIVALQAGKEAGLQPLEAVNSFYFVNGKVSMYGEMAIAQVLKAGHVIEWGKCDAETATVKIIRGDNNKMSNEVTFTMKMAQERGLTSNPVYKKYPENMLRFKAFHACAKFIVSDALHGIPMKEIVEAEYVEEVTEKPKDPVASKTETNATEQKFMDLPKQDTSLEDAINAPEKADKKQIAEMTKLIEEKGKNAEAIAAYYKAENLEGMTKEQATEAIMILKKAPKIEIEEMPKEEKKESKAAKTMREAKEKGKKVAREEGKGWPGDVCRYLRFIEGINDEDLPEDILALKADANSGNWGGYDFYPSLKEQIAMIPEDYK